MLKDKKLLRNDPLVGQLLADRYLLTDIIGIGGWGKVYAAEHQTLHKELAVKVLHTHLVFKSDAYDRFQREAEALSNLEHPGLCRLYDFGETEDGCPYFVMEKISGPSLADLIRQQGNVPLKRCLDIFIEVCEALSAAHKQGVIHRDLKPENVLLIGDVDQDEEKIKIIDFGLAKLVTSEGTEITRTGETVGTPAYMSPEQCLGQQIDGRSDIYSLACALFHALTGALPFRGESSFECMTSHMSSPPPSFCDANPSIKLPAKLEEIIHKCMEKDPVERYQNVDQLQSELMLCRDMIEKSGFKVARKRRPVTKQEKAKRRRLFAIKLSAGLLVTSVAGLLFAMTNAVSAGALVGFFYGTNENASELLANFAGVNGIIGNQELQKELLKQAAVLCEKQAKKDLLLHDSAQAEARVELAIKYLTKAGLTAGEVAKDLIVFGDDCLAKNERDIAEWFYKQSWKLALQPADLLKRSSVAEELYQRSGIESYHGNKLLAESYSLQSLAAASTLPMTYRSIQDQVEHLYQLSWANSVWERYEEAIKMALRGVALEEKLPSPNYFAISACLRSAGSFYRQLNQHDQEEKYYRQAIKAGLKAKDKGALGYAYAELGKLRSQQYKPEEALSCLKEAVPLIYASEQQHYPATASFAVSLAQAYQSKGDIDSAERTYKEAIDFLEKHGCARDPNIVPIYDQLADIYQRSDRKSEAAALRQLAEMARKNPQIKRSDYELRRAN